MESDQNSCGDPAGSGEVLPAALIGPDLPPSAIKQDSTERRWLGIKMPNMPSKEHIELTGRIIDIALRLGMSVTFLIMAWWWLSKVGCIVDKQSESEKNISDSVLIALLTTTTINVLGLLYFVANYLFPKQIGQINIAAPPAPGSNPQE